MSADKLSLIDMLKRSDGMLFLPANAAELAGVVKRTRDELGIEPPEDFMALLRLTDGALADGIMIYGSKVRDFDEITLPELIGINLERHDYREDLGGLLLIGERDDDFLAYHPADRLYWRIDRASGDLSGSARDLRGLVAALLGFSETA